MLNISISHISFFACDLLSNVKRKSIRKSVVKVSVEGIKSRLNFTLDPISQEIVSEMEKFEENKDLIHFGTIYLKTKQMKFYAFRSQPEMAFVRIDTKFDGSGKPNTSFFPLNRFKLREMVSFVTKASWFTGLYGKRSKIYSAKYHSSELYNRRSKQDGRNVGKNKPA